MQWRGDKDEDADDGDHESNSAAYVDEAFDGAW
jgi:hypothetical protein